MFWLGMAKLQSVQRSDELPSQMQQGFYMFSGKNTRATMA
ncbi:hypothetical protein CPter91_3066 [Collimonas pratensis]|uniref:Uncharacterized protein n=1 Tax=Collimonas pratensis TaxID=279113 RepID=A0A127Q5U7_9BURK|nr:hypothetical protein CPter91_3066 [Collimonas pratensis]